MTPGVDLEPVEVEGVPDAQDDRRDQRRTRKDRDFYLARNSPVGLINLAREAVHRDDFAQYRVAQC